MRSYMANMAKQVKDKNPEGFMNPEAAAAPLGPGDQGEANMMMNRCACGVKRQGDMDRRALPVPFWYPGN